MPQRYQKYNYAIYHIRVDEPMARAVEQEQDRAERQTGVRPTRAQILRALAEDGLKLRRKRGTNVIA